MAFRDVDRAATSFVISKKTYLLDREMTRLNKKDKTVNRYHRLDMLTDATQMIPG